MDKEKFLATVESVMIRDKVVCITIDKKNVYGVFEHSEIICSSRALSIHNIKVDERCKTYLVVNGVHYDSETVVDISEKKRSLKI